MVKRATLTATTSGQVSYPIRPPPPCYYKWRSVLPRRLPQVAKSPVPSGPLLSATISGEVSYLAGYHKWPSLLFHQPPLKLPRVFKCPLQSASPLQLSQMVKCPTPSAYILNYRKCATTPPLHPTPPATTSGQASYPDSYDKWQSALPHRPPP